MCYVCFHFENVLLCVWFSVNVGVLLVREICYSFVEGRWSHRKCSKIFFVGFCFKGGPLYYSCPRVCSDNPASFLVAVTHRTNEELTLQSVGVSCAVCVWQWSLGCISSLVCMEQWVCLVGPVTWFSGWNFYFCQKETNNRSRCVKLKASSIKTFTFQVNCVTPKFRGSLAPP